jgi:hypothetical protein
MAAAEAGDHGVVGNLGADDEPEPGIAAAAPFDRPARADAVAVGIEQQGQQDPRRERRLAGLAHLVGGLEGGQVHQRHGIDEKVDDVVLGQPVQHVDRQQVALAPIRLAEEAGHPVPPRLVGETESRP